LKDCRISLSETLRTSQRKPISTPRSVRAVAVYDHHPPHCFGVGFSDGESALAHHTERDDASALASAECVAVDGGGPVRFFAKRLIIHVRLRYQLTHMLDPRCMNTG